MSTFPAAHTLPKILVVEDEPAFRMLLEHALTLEGYQVRTASDGLEALEIAKTDRFDIVLTDLIMPGKEGIELILSLRAMAPKMKIIAMSGGDSRSSGDYLPLAKTLGAHAILKKPFEREALLNILNSFIPVAA